MIGGPRAFQLLFLCHPILQPKLFVRSSSTPLHSFTRSSSGRGVFGVFTQADIFPADWIQSERLNSVCPCHFVYDIFFVSVCTRFCTYARRNKATAPPIFWSTKHHQHKKLLLIKHSLLEFSFFAHRWACLHQNCSRKEALIWVKLKFIHPSAIIR